MSGYRSTLNRPFLYEVIIVSKSYSEARNQSEKLAKRYVIPLLNEYLKTRHPGRNCTIGTIESLGESFANLLDMTSGADLFMKMDTNIYLIALRISVEFYPDEFTIRYRKNNGIMTEYEKRISAMTCGAIRPFWNIHVHIHDNRLSMGIVRSDELFTYLKNMERQGKLHLGRTSDATYCYVSWEELTKAGIKVVTIQKEFDTSIMGD